MEKINFRQKSQNSIHKQNSRKLNFCNFAVQPIFQNIEKLTNKILERTFMYIQEYWQHSRGKKYSRARNLIFYSFVGEIRFSNTTALETWAKALRLKILFDLSIYFEINCGLIWHKNWVLVWIRLFRACSNCSKCSKIMFQWIHSIFTRIIDLFWKIIRPNSTSIELNNQLFF